MQWPKEKGQKIIYKALLRKLKIEQCEPHNKLRLNPSQENTYQLSGCTKECLTLNCNG
jgi:hypothetical protein